MIGAVSAAVAASQGVSPIVPAIVFGGLIAVAIVLMARRGRGGDKPRTHTLNIPALTLPGIEPVRDMQGIPYHLHHDKATSGGIAAQPNNSVRVSGWIEVGALRGSGAHCGIALRNDTNERDHDKLPAGPWAPTTGVGVIIGDMGGGQPDYPEDEPLQFVAVPERFVKLPAADGSNRILYPDAESPILPDRVWLSVVSQRRGAQYSLQYRIFGDGVDFCSPPLVLEQDYDLGGDDVSRALFPAAGGVVFEPMRCDWSIDPLQPLGPPTPQDL